WAWNPDCSTLQDLVELPRSQVAVLGGDLAYPNPSYESYESRLFRPFEDAFPPPPWYSSAYVAVNKPDLPPGMDSLKSYSGPQCFAIPGNHDWFDGLDTFLRKICHKGWLGGWLLPQQNSYFALALPHGWWVFALDLALPEDIDMHQLKYFSKVAKERVGPDDAVIIVTHQPMWLQYWYFNPEKVERPDCNLMYLIRHKLGARARVWLAGDLHFYLRHTAARFPPCAHPGSPNTPKGVPYFNRSQSFFHPSRGPAPLPEHLVVCGGGGAFLHPTHAFETFKHAARGKPYECSAAFPSFQTSRMLAYFLLPLFREHNWRFDFIGGILYFLLSCSLFPVCNLTEQFTAGSVLGNLAVLPGIYYQMVLRAFSEGALSPLCFLGLIGAAVAFVGEPHKLSSGHRVLLGTVHAAAHTAMALVLMLVLELFLDLCVANKVLGRAGIGGLWNATLAKQQGSIADLAGIASWLEYWTFGVYPHVVKYICTVFDLPEVMAATRQTICTAGWAAVPRSESILYNVAVLVYYWVLCTPVVSWIFGVYLYHCINWLSVHFDEAFCALRIPHYKSFLRLRVTPRGALEVFAIGVRKVPRKWVHSAQSGKKAAYTSPSKWVPAAGQPGQEGACEEAELVDYFRVEKLLANPPSTPSKAECN
ncbi:hypothetical protein CYMTET_28662, partial [Cymbomonas tetramitiformis]